MYCGECGTELFPNSKFCSECGKFVGNKGGNYIRTGKKSINFIANSDSKINTRDIYINSNMDRDEIEYEQVQYGKKIEVNTVRKFKKVAHIITGIGLISSIITIINFFIPFNISIIDNIPLYVKSWLFYVTIFGAIILLGTRELINGRSLSFPLNIEFKKINDKYISKIVNTGICPICGGKVFVVKIKENNNDGTQIKERRIGICENDDEHRFTFDKTILKGERIK